MPHKGVFRLKLVLINRSLMGKIKKQLKFPTSQQAEKYFDCPMSGEQYVELLKEIGELPPTDDDSDNT